MSQLWNVFYQLKTIIPRQQAIQLSDVFQTKNVKKNSGDFLYLIFDKQLQFFLSK